MTKAQRGNATLFVAGASAVPDLGIALFVFGLPFIDLYFAVDPWYSPYVAASTLAFVGLSLSFTGSLSDFFGRRPILIAFFLMAAALTFTCVFATNYKFVLALRAAQVIVAAAGLVVARAIASDINETKAGVSQTMGVPVLIFGAIYLLAASLSGWLNNQFGLQSVTMMIGILLATLALWIALGFQETATFNRKQRNFFVSLFLNHIRLLGSGEFLGYTLILSFTMTIFVPFLLLFPTLATDRFGLSAVELGWINMAMILALTLGVIANRRFVGEMGIPPLVRFSAFAIIVFGMLMAVLGLVTALSIEMLIVAFLLLSLIVGASHPALLAGGASVDPKHAGTASGIALGLGLVLGGGAYQLCVSVFDGRTNSLATIAGISAVLAGLSYGLLLRPKKVKRREREEDFSMGGVQGSNGL